MSTKSENKKSAPMIGLGMTATMKIQEKEQRSPRLRVSEQVPYVEIGVLLTAIRASLSGGCLRLCVEGGTTLTSDPVSTK